MSLVLKTADEFAFTAGSYTTVAAADTVATGLRKVVAVMATLSSDPVAGCAAATASIPDQVTGPGNITISTWQPTAQANSIPTAATTFSKVVNWVAWGR